MPLFPLGSAGLGGCTPLLCALLSSLTWELIINLFSRHEAKVPHAGHFRVIYFSFPVFQMNRELRIDFKLIRVNSSCYQMLFWAESD